MTPAAIYNQVCAFSGDAVAIVCDLHSACSPRKRRPYLCGHAGSKIPVVDFDRVEGLIDKSLKQKSRKSVDALAVTPSGKFLCFVELKSWELFLTYNDSEESVKEKAAKYSSDLPIKLTDSMQICREITHNPNAFDGCGVLYVLVTDISVADDGWLAFNSDMAALAGTASNLKALCNSLSRGAIHGISTVETRYWECRDFDNNLSPL